MSVNVSGLSKDRVLVSLSLLRNHVRIFLEHGLQLFFSQSLSQLPEKLRLMSDIARPSCSSANFPGISNVPSKMREFQFGQQSPAPAAERSRCIPVPPNTTIHRKEYRTGAVSAPMFGEFQSEGVENREKIRENLISQKIV